ncbi:Uncharacterised protein [Klebsiella michiganensis]|nr:Uncharacterised protein [Klebsiella michiganensis]
MIALNDKRNWKSFKVADFYSLKNGKQRNQMFITYHHFNIVPNSNFISNNTQEKIAIKNHAIVYLLVQC